MAGVQQFMIQNKTELQKDYQTTAGFIALEDGTSTGLPSPVLYSKLGDARSASDATLNLNCISV